jgi:GT2 family glycosyltransferase
MIGRTKPAPAVPVMILNWNGWDDTFQCLRSVLACSDVDEVWLVDNGSNEDRSEEARAVYPGLRVLQLNENYGWAGGYNRVLQVAIREGYRFAYLLNNDTTVESGFLASLLSIASRHPDAAGIGSTVVYAGSSQSVMFDGIFHDRNARFRSSATGEAPVHSLSGAGMLIRLSAISACGAFDERFFCYYEDTEWCSRVRRAGHMVLLSNESVIVHRSQASDHNGNTDYYSTRNAVLFHRLTSGSRMAVLSVAYKAIRQASALRLRGDHSHAQAIAQGLADGLTGRFGPRHEPTLLARLILHLWPFRQGMFREKLGLTTRDES